MISPVTWPAEEYRRLVTESVVQQHFSLSCGGTWFPGNLGAHRHDRQLTGLLTSQRISILVLFVV